MQKFIKILAIIAMALVALSLLLMLITYPFQNGIAKTIFGGYPQVMEGILPIFPWMSFLLDVLKLGCMILLIVCCGKQTGGIWLEILVFALLAVVLPGINRFATPLYTLWLNRLGEYYSLANSYVSSIVNFCTTPSGLGSALAYTVCGMSIVYKKMHK